MKWWKDPRLDDEGTYDYLIEPLPKDYAKWQFNKWASRCDTCGKERHLTFHSEHYFYCWDGWDSMGYTDCWMCMLKNKIHSIKWKIKKHIKVFKTAMELYKTSPSENFKYCYKMAWRLER